MLGSSGYDRVENDFYRTPDSAIDSYLLSEAAVLQRHVVWECAAGDGALVRRFKDLAPVISTDIAAYPGFEPDAFLDFLTVQHLCEIEPITGRRPTAIVTNPPYGTLAADFARQALKLTREDRGYVALLCRNEWDTAGDKRADLFQHPAFARKLVMFHRPRWIKDSTGSPRHQYAWYVWDWSRAVGARPEIIYVP